MKSLILWVVVVLVIVGGAFVLLSGPGDSGTEELAEMEEGFDFQNEGAEPGSQVPVGGSGGQFLQRQPDQATPPGVVEDVIVSMTDTGFSPENVTISAGDKVTFVNDGQAKHWPASDVHPTHEILSEFDAKRGLSTGESYSYVFVEVGTWDFHDHLRASFTGTVTVE